jgi:predicted ribosomally synthesized peptide with SipW-like signal peptide
MKKIMPLMASVMLILVAGMFAGAGTRAIFSDTEKVSVADISAGTLDLKLDGGDVVVSVDIHDIKPGDTITRTWKLLNDGSLPGVLSVEFSPITNNDNGCNDPETQAEIAEYLAASPGDTKGELGAYLRANVMQSHLGGSDLSWTISDYHAHDLTGYLDPHTKALSFGLNYLGGKTMAAPETLPAGGGFKLIKLTLSLDKDIWNRAAGWGGGSDFDIDDNVIQSDAVYFDITFHLDQVPPP